MFIDFKQAYGKVNRRKFLMALEVLGIRKK